MGRIDERLKNSPSSYRIRMTVGVAVLPYDVAVEVEAIFEAR